MYKDAFELVSSLVDEILIDYVKFNKETISVKFTQEPKEIEFNLHAKVAEDILELLETYK